MDCGYNCPRLMSLNTEQGEPDEQAVIDGICASATHRAPWVRVGPGDDGAVLADGTVLVADAMVQGVHWDLRVTAAEVGFKLARANLSDIAAMGAEARWALLTLSLPRPVEPIWVKEFADGLAEGLDGVPLIGGDTTRSTGPVCASLTVGGQLVDRPLLRSGAAAGDTLWVSGALGAASLAFHLPKPGPALWQAWVRPRPPLSLGPALAASGLATAALDLSDGLARDLARLCAASRVGARVDPAALPCPAELDRTTPDWLDHAVAWGEDFGLLFTAPAASDSSVAALGTSLGVRLTRIGRCTDALDLVLEGTGWPTSWGHFSGAAP